VYIANCPRLKKYYQVDGEYSHISIPLEARGQKFGIINLLPTDEKPISDDDLDLLASIGAQISEIVANAWLRLKLMEKEVSRQALLESLVKAQEEERGRLARELHDGAGQTLTSLLVRMKTLEKTNSSPEAKKSLNAMEEIIVQTIEQIRELSYRLRPIVLEEFGLSVALDNLVNETVATSGLEFKFESQLSGQQLSSEVEVALYRIAQEGITNILRHAHAHKVSLKLNRQSTGIQLCVDDDGIGFDPSHLPGDPSKPHLGLISMRERAEMLGGTLDVYTASGDGTSIQAFIPLKDAS
jgi:signal transduction histidine kinase